MQDVRIALEIDRTTELSRQPVTERNQLEEDEISQAYAWLSSQSGM